MTKMTLAAVTVASLSFFGQTASAAWLFQDYESAFDEGNSVHAALTLGRYGGFGVRCHGEKLNIVYMLSKTDFDADTVEKSNSLGIFKLKVRVDKSTVEEMDATASLSEDDTFVLVSAATKQQIEQIRDAKKQIAVAMSLIGQNYYEDKISVSGSTTTVQKVLDACASNDAAAKAKID